ncbi:hypothetical protein [Marinobacter sp. DY40_1A1]|uniref:hypothetical protein n=1 Tax=Marinobacter sp. DY40_1A1 TaxID=2583229 RepID=UPI001908DAFC|nr:hypothetical protein [Marinobacter sp. DY40_1A1]MBK1887238.1 hypothetical protein [Marinobacter sp. DY40_1A1]
MFRGHTIRQCMLTLLLSILAFSAQAEKLTDSTIRAFIASMQDAQILEDQYKGTEGWPDADDEDMGSMPDLSRLFSEGVKKMKGGPAYDKYESLVKKHGFKNLPSWASVGDRVFAAMMAVEMKSADATSEMAEVMAEMESDPNLSPEIKAQMQAMMGAAINMTKTADNVPAADIEAIRPHLKALKAVLNDDED